MTVQTAITQADKLRPNKLGDDIKVAWLYELDAEFAEMMNIDLPGQYDTTTMLLIPTPYDQVYPYHIMAQIDLALEEMDRYQIDAISANQRLSQVKAWWRRNHKPDTRRRFEVMN